MNTFRSLTLTLGTALLAIAPALSRADTNLLTNGSFENVPFAMSGGGTYCYMNAAIVPCAAQLPGWEGSVAPIMTSTSAAFGASPNTVTDHHQIGLQRNSFISQSVAAGSYVLSWSDAPRAGGLRTYDIWRDNDVLATFTPASDQGWGSHSLTVVASPVPWVLTFQGRSDEGDATAFIDNVSLTAAVPEPSTWALMIGGIVGLGFTVRSRSRSA